jgi:hypothetical protein
MSTITRMLLKPRDDGTLIIDIDGRGTLDEIMCILLNATLFLMKQVVEKAPEEKQKEVELQVYNLFNYRATGVLETFAPDLELRPDLTSEAIMKAENELLEDELSKMPIFTP